MYTNSFFAFFFTNLVITFLFSNIPQFSGVKWVAAEDIKINDCTDQLINPQNASKVTKRFKIEENVENCIIESAEFSDGAFLVDICSVIKTTETALTTVEKTLMTTTTTTTKQTITTTIPEPLSLDTNFTVNRKLTTGEGILIRGKLDDNWREIKMELKGLIGGAEKQILSIMANKMKDLVKIETPAVDGSLFIPRINATEVGGSLEILNLHEGNNNTLEIQIELIKIDSRKTLFGKEEKLQVSFNEKPLMEHKTAIYLNFAAAQTFDSYVIMIKADMVELLQNTTFQKGPVFIGFPNDFLIKMWQRHGKVLLKGKVPKNIDKITVDLLAEAYRTYKDENGTLKIEYKRKTPFTAENAQKICKNISDRFCDICMQMVNDFEKNSTEIASYVHNVTSLENKKLLDYKMENYTLLDPGKDFTIYMEILERKYKLLINGKAVMGNDIFEVPVNKGARINYIQIKEDVLLYSTQFILDIEPNTTITQ